MNKLRLLIFVFTFLACTPNAPKVDISNISLDIKILRFEKDLFELKQNQDFKLFKKKFEHILPIYSNKVIGLGNPEDSGYLQYLNKFLFDSTMTLVANRVNEKYPNLNQIEGELTDAFKYMKYYFPNKKTPSIYTQISGFNQSIVVSPDLIGISLDKYLGKDCEFYSYLGTPLYARENMTSERIGQDVILAYALTEFPFHPIKDDLISNMIYQGKIRYLVQSLMPKKSEADIMKYTPDQLAWCKENEELIWGFIIEQKHLFSTEYRTIIKYINDGPFTSGMPQESPSRTGIWLGWQIVNEYMKSHKDLSLSDLMKENDYGLMLRESAYQP